MDPYSSSVGAYPGAIPGAPYAAGLPDPYSASAMSAYGPAYPGSINATLPMHSTSSLQQQQLLQQQQQQQLQHQSALVPLPVSTLREDFVQNAMRFLQNPEVVKSSPATRVVFLEKKGLAAGEIAEALRRVMPLAPETALVATAASKGQSASAAVAGLADPAQFAAVTAAGNASGSVSGSHPPAATSDSAGGLSTVALPGMVQVGPTLFAYPYQLHPSVAATAAASPASSAAAAASLAAVARRSPARASWLSSLLSALTVAGAAAASIALTRKLLLSSADAEPGAASGALVPVGSNSNAVSQGAEGGDVLRLTHKPASDAAGISAGLVSAPDAVAIAAAASAAAAAATAANGPRPSPSNNNNSTGFANNGGFRSLSGGNNPTTRSSVAELVVESQEDIFIKGFNEVKATITDLTSALAATQSAAAGHTATLASLAHSLAPVASLAPACDAAQAAAVGAQRAAEAAVAAADRAAERAAAAAEAAGAAPADGGAAATAREAALAATVTKAATDAVESAVAAAVTAAVARAVAEVEARAVEREAAREAKAAAAAAAAEAKAAEAEAARGGEAAWGKRFDALQGALEAVEQILGTLVQVQVQQQHGGAGGISATGLVGSSSVNNAAASASADAASVNAATAAAAHVASDAQEEGDGASASATAHTNTRSDRDVKVKA